MLVLLQFLTTKYSVISVIMETSKKDGKEEVPGPWPRLKLRLAKTHLHIMEAISRLRNEAARLLGEAEN